VTYNVADFELQLTALDTQVVDPGFWSGKRILLTGHTGFKGSWLALWLTTMGAEVVGLSNSQPSQPGLVDVARVGERVESFEADVRDLERVTQITRDVRPDLVLHLAAQPLVRQSYAEPVETYSTNVMGTVNVLEAVRLAGSVRAVVAVTSDKCYENREWDWGYREDEPLGGRDPYSSSKACAELVIAGYRSSFFNVPGSPAVASARAGNVIGGGDWGADRLVPDLMRAAFGNTPARVRNPEAVRPWQHVLNPLSGYLILAQSLWNSRAFADGWNFGPADGEVRPVGWIVDRITAMWGPGLRWELDPTEQPHEAHSLRLDSARARTRLGWRPHWDLEHALRATVDWYRAYRDGADMQALTLAQIKAYQTTSQEGLPGV
jgi:CDP-glucose 4,6-dehydratase